MEAEIGGSKIVVTNNTNKKLKEIVKRQGGAAAENSPGDFGANDFMTFVSRELLGKEDEGRVLVTKARRIRDTVWKK